MELMENMQHTMMRIIAEPSPKVKRDAACYKRPSLQSNPTNAKRCSILTMKTIIITDHSCKLESSLKLLWRTTKLKNGNCGRINPASSDPLWSFDLKNYWIQEELMIAIIRGWWCWKGCTNLSNCRLCLIDAEVVLAYEAQWQNASLQNIVKISLQLAASWREKEHCKLGHQMHGLATLAFHSWIKTIWYGNQSDAAPVGPTKSSDWGEGGWGRRTNSSSSTAKNGQVVQSTSLKQGRRLTGMCLWLFDHNQKCKEIIFCVFEHHLVHHLRASAISLLHM